MAVDDFTLQNVLKAYRMFMLSGNTGLMPHGFGPPGAGKTWAVEQAAKILGVNLHVINLARMSPLEVEGIQMPTDGNSRLDMLIAPRWTSIKEGDIVLFDECLRAYPEVFNATLDIYTSRTVAGYQIAPSFWVGASNSIATYDPALEDRLLHMPVPDIRSSNGARRHTRKTLVMATGMHPDMIDNMDLIQLIEQEVMPTYGILDDLAAGRPAQHTKGSSVRNLIAQVQLRQFKSKYLDAVIQTNNMLAANDPAHQIFAACSDVEKFKTLLESDRLTPIQRVNAQTHLELAELHAVLAPMVEEDEDEDDIFN